MRILITGPAGQVGWECQRSLQVLGDLVCASRDQCDLARPDSIRALIRGAAPDVIVNAAAYTAVDRAESEPELARAVNAEAPAVMAEEARRLGASLIHLSTDYVFDGSKQTPYVEEDVASPLSAYGRTKWQGEQALHSSGVPAIILRTSWVYAARGNNFVRTILRLAHERDELRIVNDQWGAPTWARSIAEAIAAIIARAGRDRQSIAASAKARGGIFHMTAAGRTNWYDFAQEILRQEPDPARKVKSLLPISSAEYPTPARRPANSVLSCARLQELWGVSLPRWDIALEWALRSNDANR
jgi:dTDP-4-dehydrorhamnose reductase